MYNNSVCCRYHCMNDRELEFDGWQFFEEITKFNFPTSGLTFVSINSLNIKFNLPK